MDFQHVFDLKTRGGGGINFFNFTALRENKRPCSIQTRLVDQSNVHCATEINTKLNVGDIK